MYLAKTTLFQVIFWDTYTLLYTWKHRVTSICFTIFLCYCSKFYSVTVNIFKNTVVKRKSLTIELFTYNTSSGPYYYFLLCVISVFWKIGVCRTERRVFQNQSFVWRAWSVLQCFWGKEMEIFATRTSLNVLSVCYSDGENGENPSLRLKGEKLMIL